LRKPAIATRVSPAVNNAVRQLSKALGITVSEYLRKLILDDLESKRIFNEQFTKMTGTPETKEAEERPEDSIKKLLSRMNEEENNENFW
jgi:hypothetical protein